MDKLTYSAGAVSKGFWFEEFKKYIQFLNEGKTPREIRNLQENDNVFLAPSPSYGKRMIGEISKRIKALPKEILDLFLHINISDQKLINLLGIMITDRLFFEFIYQVYREDIIIGRKHFEDSNSRVFFKNKSEESEKVAEYTDQTKRRLAGAYKTYLREAGLIIDDGESTLYNKPIIDLQLEEYLEKPELYPYLKALTGRK